MKKFLVLAFFVIMLIGIGIGIGIEIGKRTTTTITGPEFNPQVIYELETEEGKSTGRNTEEERDTVIESQVNPQLDEINFANVGYGKEWEDGIFAPFADMGAWISDGIYGNSGAINLGKVMDDIGVEYYNLGFINAVDNTVDADGVLNWGFGGYEVLSEDYTGVNEQYDGIKKSMKDVRDAGGDVTISIGGLNERNFFQYTNDLEVLVNTYVEIIDGFNLTRIDLDIEGGAQGYAMNELNAKAIKEVQDMTGVEVVITLPVMPTGLTTGVGLDTLQVYVDYDVDIKAVNIMAMCYGASAGDYATASVKAIDSTMKQIKDVYANVGTQLTEAEAYDKVGVTTSIGHEGDSHPLFSVDDSRLVVEYAKEKQINFVSFWSLNRDTKTQENEGINKKYEHTNVYLDFQEDIGCDAPILSAIGEENSYEELGVIEWSREEEANGTFTPGTVVTYKGVTYEQVSSSTSWWCEPGTNAEVWEVQ